MKKNYLKNILLFILKIPYYIVKGIIFLIKKLNTSVKDTKIKKQRESIKPIYEEFKALTDKEDFKKWVDKIYSSDSNIGVIIGARGTGKTAFGLKFLENAYAKTKKNCYAMGFSEKGMPSWINIIKEISEIKNNSFVLVDEGGILFSSRMSMSSGNKLLSELILISRHKNLTILFISQNSSNLEVNALRQADFLVLKPSSLLQKDFERKIIQKIYDSTSKDFEKYKDIDGITYLYGSTYKGFISNDLPSFWKENISKSFR